MVNGLVVLLQGGASLCSAAALWLRSHGYAVREDATMDGLLAQVSEARPDVLIVDVSTAVDAVDALCRRVKSNPKLELLPILALTSPGEPIEPKSLNGASDELAMPQCCDRILVRRLDALVGAASAEFDDREVGSTVPGADIVHWRQVVAHLPHSCVAVFDRETRLVFGTGPWEAPVGSPIAEWLARLPDVFRESQDVLAALVRRAFETPQARPFEQTERLGPYTYRALSLMDPTGQVAEVILMVQEAVAGPTAGTGEAENTLRFGAFVDATPEPMAVIDSELNIRYLNAAAELLLGVRKEDIPVAAGFSKSYVDTYRPFIDAVFRDGAWRRLVLPFVVARKLTWQDVTLSPVRDEAGRITAVMACARDITAQQLVRIRLERHSRRLQALNELGQALVAGRDPAAIAGTLLRLASPTIGAEASVFMLRTGDLFQVVDIWGSFTDQQRERFKAWRLPSNRVPEPGIWDAEAMPSWALRARDLTGFDIGSLMFMPVQNGTDTIGLVGAVHRSRHAFHDEDWQFFQSAVQWASIAVRNAQLYSDVAAALDDRRRTEGHLVQAEKVAAIGRLAASLTHEVNNPLQAVRGCLELAAEELALPQRPEQLPRYVAVALEELGRVSRLVGGMRELYRPAAPEVRECCVRELVSGVLELLSRQLRDHRIDVECDIDPGLPKLALNADQIRQVLINVILNAIDAMPDGGMLQIRAQLVRRAVAGQDGSLGVEVLVYDDGVGISEQAEARLFEPFFTTKPSGSGLGLYTSYGLIQAHRGVMSVCRRVTGGTRVAFWLPFDGSSSNGGDDDVSEDTDR